MAKTKTKKNKELKQNSFLNGALYRYTWNSR